jgi:hypothetical protein
MKLPLNKACLPFSKFQNVFVGFYRNGSLHSSLLSR